MLTTIRSLITWNTLLLFLSNCTTAQNIPTPSEVVVFVGCTPGDASIKQMLSIPEDTVDFIRWRLLLHPDASASIQLQYGLSQPNTLGFQHGGQFKTLEGYFRVDSSAGQGKRMYYFKSKSLPGEIVAMVLNDNLLHLMGAEQQMLLGNGGWSYTLNRQEPLQSVGTSLPALVPANQLLRDTSSKVVFAGRTPSADIARIFQLTLPPGAFKLKWKLTLLRDPQTHQPTRYQLKRTDRRAAEIEGKWAVLQGTSGNPRAVIYQLDPDQPEKTMSLWAGDEKLLFFMDKEGHLLTGNGDFSCTLNKME